MMLRRILAFFGLALKKDLDEITSAYVGLYNFVQLAGLLASDISMTVEYTSATSDTPKQ